MCRPSWHDSLATALTAQAKRLDRPPRVAVIGIGHDLRGDDAAGALLARELQKPSPRTPLPHGEGQTRPSAPPLHEGEGAGGEGRVLILDGGPAPENVTGAVRRFRPDVVLLVDAADLGEQPGAVRWLDWQQIGGVSAFTHTLPLDVLARYLTAELGCEVALIGIQPGRTDFDAPLTPAVRAAVEEVAAGLADLLNAAHKHT